MSNNTKRRLRVVRYFVVAFKLITGTAELVAGALITIFPTHELARFVDIASKHEFAHDPGDLLFNFVHHQLPGILLNKHIVGLALIGLGLIKLIGGVGLLLHRPWAYYLLVAALVALLPADIVHAIRQQSVLSTLLLAMNALVLGVLVAFRRPLIEQEKEGI
ncbi:MAG: DUF2127 domain-containing protein [Actinomycetota bacterium]|nr:DUF2127 domain-containing protein [Actinomycetota bacterium]